MELSLDIPAEGVDLFCHIMTEIGSLGVIVEDRPLDTFHPPDPDVFKAASYQVKAYFPPADDPEQLREAIRDQLIWLAAIIPDLSSTVPDLRTVRHEDWAENWKQHFTTLRIGPRLVVRPSWENFQADKGDAVVTLDPGMAFGTGTHGTTRLCLEALARRFEQPPPPGSVLDVGTGSGILAIAAAALGARRVVACDIDQEACRTAADNSRANGVEEQIEITDLPLDQIAGTFQVVLANILAEENIRLAPRLVEKLAEDGLLILSGILLEKEALVKNTFRHYNLSGPEISHQDEWSCLAYRKKA
ncbi:MAG: 50S ribosomal protein L11 methyltransferase [Syntrophotaleaceae bacterium]